MGKKRRKASFRTALSIGDVMAAESERGCVLAGHAYLDYTLAQRLLKAFNVNVADKNDGTIHDDDAKLVDRVVFGQYDEIEATIAGSFSARVTLARICGVIDRETRAALNLLNRGRIRCAHHPEAFVIGEDWAKDVFNAMNDRSKDHANSARKHKAIQLNADKTTVATWSDARQTLMYAIIGLYCETVGGSLMLISGGEHVFED